MGEKTVVLEFSKILNQNISLTAFEFKPSIPIQNIKIGGSPNELVLEFEQNIQEGIYYESTVSNLRDCTGNLFESDQKIFFVILHRNILVSYGTNHPRPKRMANFVGI